MMYVDWFKLSHYTFLLIYLLSENRWLRYPHSERWQLSLENFQVLVFRTQFVLPTTVKCSYDFLLLGSHLFVNGFYKRNNRLWFWRTDGQDMIHGFRQYCVRLFWRTSKTILFSSFPGHGLAQRFGTISYPCEHSFIRVAQNQCLSFLPNVSISV